MSSAVKKMLITLGAVFAVIAIIVLLIVWVVRGPFPRTSRDADREGTERAGGGAPGQVRCAAHPGRHDARPVLCPGIRHCAGQVLADGLLAAHRRREAVGDIREVDPWHGQVPADGGVPQDRRAGIPRRWTRTQEPPTRPTRKV